MDTQTWLILAIAVVLVAGQLLRIRPKCAKCGKHPDVKDVEFGSWTIPIFFRFPFPRVDKTHCSRCGAALRR